MIGRSVRQRIAVTAACFGAIFAILIGRAIHLTVMRGSEMRALAAQQHLRSVSMLSRRGPILDRSGGLLALTRQSVSVYLRPYELTAHADRLAEVAGLLDLPVEVVMRRAQDSARFVYLKRQVSPERWLQVEALGIRGIDAEPDRRRVYPRGALAGHVLGFIGIDGQGLEGVELALDADLRGEVEALDVERDARGRWIVVDGRWRPLPRVGAEIELTIDAGLQRVAETELERTVHDFRATAASAVVMVPDTGEVLALANVPRFDPNRFAEMGAAEWRNRAITDFYEPGSTFKAVLAAAALESGVVTPEEEIFCENGRYAVGRTVIHDHHPHEVLTFADVIAQSSNIGCAKVVERLGRERFAAALAAFGFGRPTGIELPGEVAGLMRPVADWDSIGLVTAAFGQGIAVTPLQLTRAFAAIANGGELMRPYIVRRIVSQDGEVRRIGRPQVEGRVMSRRTARALTEILTRVVREGTGKLAEIDGFTVAGKTGTAQKVDPVAGGYHPRDRMSSFVGYVPADDPELVVLVVVDTPTRASTYGGIVAAPAFRRIAEYGLARRGVRPRSVPLHERWPEAVPEVQPAALRLAPLADPEAGVPSFLGLSMREALVRAQKIGLAVRLEGSGYVMAQEPAAGADQGAHALFLRFGSGDS